MTGPYPHHRGSDYWMPPFDTLAVDKLLAGREARKAQWITDRATSLRHSRVRFPQGSPPPYGCRWCGRPADGHGVTDWIASVGFHSWTRPTTAQTFARMKARRSDRAEARRLAPVLTAFERGADLVGPAERRRRRALAAAAAQAPVLAGSRRRVCDEMNHNSVGRETFCQEDPDDGHPVHDDGDGTTWDRED